VYAGVASLPPPSEASSSTKRLALVRPSRFESMGVAVPKVEVERERTASFSNADVEAVSKAELPSVRESHSQGSCLTLRFSFRFRFKLVLDLRGLLDAKMSRERSARGARGEREGRARGKRGEREIRKRESEGRARGRG